jgi:BON domain
LSTCVLAALVSSRVAAGELVQLDPFAQATNRLARCPPAKPRLYTPEEMRTEAHLRIERGTRCALEGTCEPGGAYKRDAEINESVRAAIAADRRFAGTSVWVTTSRKWVTLKGCVRTKAERSALVGFVRKRSGVERVFDELQLGAADGPR